MRVVVADFRVTGSEHLIVNSAIIEGLKENSIESIDVFAEDGHLRSLISAFPTIMKGVNAYSFHRHHYPSRFKTLFFRELLLPLKLIRVMFHARNAQLLLITSITPFGHLVLNALSLFIGPKTACISLVHSELEVMEGQRRSLSRLAMRIWKRTVSDRISYVVLSPHIAKNINAERISRLRISSIFHPFTSSLVLTSPINRHADENRRKIRVGVPGIIKSETTKAKHIFTLEKRLADAGRQDVELYLIGRATRGFAPPDGTRVHMPFIGRTSPVPQEEFDKAISEMDVILIMYDKSSYRFTASGAVLDVLKFGQPLYAARNPLFDYMESEGIFPGFLAESVDSLLDEIVHGLSFESLAEKRDDYSKSFSSLIERTNPEINASLILKIAS